MPYKVEKRGKQYCVVGPNRTHGCHDSRADAIKQQRALYKNAPEALLPAVSTAAAAELMTKLALSAPKVTMSRVDKRIPVKDVALLRMALKRTGEAAEQEVEQAISIASGLADPEVAAQTVALIGHLADRLRTAELNQAALVDVLQAVAADSSASRKDLLTAITTISERLAEAPQVNVTVPVPDVHVNVGQASKQVEIKRDEAGKVIGATTGPRAVEIELERDSSGKLVGATTDDRTIELERDSSGRLIGAVVEGNPGSNRSDEEAK